MYTNHTARQVGPRQVVCVGIIVSATFVPVGMRGILGGGERVYPSHDITVEYFTILTCKGNVKGVFEGVLGC